MSISTEDPSRRLSSLNQYHFISRWRVEGTCGEVADVLGDPLALEVTDSRYPYGFTLVAKGDFDGAGVWTFEQDGAFVIATYDWRLSAEKPLLKTLSFLLKPIFEANHRWAMAQGETSLRLELARRRATSDAARTRVPPPPGPVTYAGVALLASAAAVAAGLAYLIVRTRRR